MNYKYMIVALILMWSPVLSAAEFYRYRGNDGVLRFTDNLGEVPENQRAMISKYSGVVETSKERDENPQNSLPEAGDEKKENGRAVSAEAEVQEFNKAQAAELSSTKSKLAEEYEKLNKEKEQLEKPKKKRASLAEIEKYKQAAQNLNARIKAYEEKRKAFEEDVRVYNQMIGQETE